MADGKITQDMVQYMVKQLEAGCHPQAREGLRRQVRYRPPARISAQVGQGRGRSGLGAAKRQDQAFADRRLFRRHLLHRADLRRLPRHRRRDRLLPVPARGSRAARRAKARARSRRTATWARSAIAWSSRGRRTTPTSASSGRCSTTRARWSSPPATPRSAAPTISASGTIRTIRWNRSPNIA